MPPTLKEIIGGLRMHSEPCLLASACLAVLHTERCFLNSPRLTPKPCQLVRHSKTPNCWLAAEILFRSHGILPVGALSLKCRD